MFLCLSQISICLYQHHLIDLHVYAYICDNAGFPLCANQSRIFWKHQALYPGTPFNILVAVVGGDFGTTSPGLACKHNSH